MKPTDLFVNEETKEFKILGFKFKYKPVTAGDENEWLSEYLEIYEEQNENGQIVRKQRTNYGELNKCKCRNIKAVPFDKEAIGSIIGTNKEWEELSKDERWQVLSKLKPEVFSLLIEEMDKIDKGADKKKPN